MTKPNSISNIEEANDLANWEWTQELNEESKALWPGGKKAYVTARVANFAARSALPEPAEADQGKGHAKPRKPSESENG